MTNIPACDYHIHTKYLGCANATMEIPAIIAECKRLGVSSLGITDHLNSPDKLDLHGPIRSDIEALAGDIDVYFGVEVGDNFIYECGDDEVFAYDEEIRGRYGFQFAIGGIHSTHLETYDLKKIVDIQHHHHLKTCRNPIIDVLVHPYWFGKYEFDPKNWPWFDSMKPVPQSYARELGQTAKETGTAIEINGCANLENGAYNERYVEEYIEFLATIAEQGASFSLGSDAHDISGLASIGATWKVAEKLNLTAERIFQPTGKPLIQNKTA